MQINPGNSMHLLDQDVPLPQPHMPTAAIDRSESCDMINPSTTNASHDLAWLDAAFAHTGEPAAALVDRAEQIWTGSKDIAPDPLKAVDLFERAHNLGNSDGTLGLARMYEYGSGGLVRNPHLAFALASKVAEEGNPKAHVALGKLGTALRQGT